MSKITVTTIAGATSGADANKVKIESGDELNVVNGDLTVDTNTFFVDASADKVAVGTNSPNTASSAAALQINKDGEALRIDGSANTAREIFFRGTSSSNLASVHSDGSLKLRAEDSGTHMEFHTADTLRMKIDASGNVTMPNQPSFQVQATPSVDGNGKLYSFGTIRSNVGSHYNNGLGRFTAPVAGVYLFYAHIWPSGTMDINNTYLTFQKNGVEQFGGHTANDRDGITIIGNFTLAVNDYIELDIQGGWSIQGSTPRNNFGGHLIG